jgi:hypothetical protein
VGKTDVQVEETDKTNVDTVHYQPQLQQHRPPAGA